MVDLERRKRARLDIDPSLNFVSSDESDNESLCSLSSHGFSQTEMQVRGNPGPPNSFLCPISQDVMFDPVLDAEGNSFDRQALIGWLQEHRTSPISGKPLCDRMVVPNKALREAIHEYMGRQWVTRKMFQTRRVSFEEETELSSDASDEDISPIRAKINCFLQEHTSHVLGGLDLRLNEEGCCAFRHENATVVLDVPESVGVICFYTRDLIPEHIEQSSDRDQLYQKALQMNFLQGETRGGCLSVRTHEDGESELVFSYTDRVCEIGPEDFTNILLNFVGTMLSLRRRLLSHLEQASNKKDLSNGRSSASKLQRPPMSPPSSPSAPHKVPATIG